MIEAMQMFFFGVLASSTFVATILMMFNFPRIRAAQRALLVELHRIRTAQEEVLGDLNGVRGVFDHDWGVMVLYLNKLEERVKELERHAD